VINWWVAPEKELKNKNNNNNNNSLLIHCSGTHVDTYVVKEEKLISNRI